MADGADLNQLIESRASGEEARRLVIFAQRLFARATPDFLQLISSEQQIAIAHAGLQFFSHRAEEVAVRVVAGTTDDVTIVETDTLDCAFIVDSLLEYFHAIGAPVRAMLHPIFHVARDRSGNIESFENAALRERAESFVHAELEIKTTPERADAIAAEVRHILIEVRRAADDFERMTERALQICDETAAARELVEMREFLRWLVRGGFVFLGYRQYRAESRNSARALAVEPGSGLGVLAEYPGSLFAPPSPLDQFSDGELSLFFDGPVLSITKSSIESQVHRRRAMDSIMIRRVAPNGKAAGFDRFVGLFTSKAFAEEAEHIPILRAKLHEVLSAEGATAGSHDFKEIVGAFNTFPKEELFRASVEELRKQLQLLSETKADAAVRLNIVSDSSRQQIIALV
ncbi:MAG TPA: hypothetical protein VKV03_04065, partial [Candidatus Binataceae bacterium]|nr:hypothetical protein [Candidatus Binataceae bacterium]